MKGPIDQAKQVLLSLESMEDKVNTSAGSWIEAFRSGHKTTCGNGGSACEAQDLVGELMGGYKLDRPPSPALP